MSTISTSTSLKCQRSMKSKGSKKSLQKLDTAAQTTSYVAEMGACCSSKNKNQGDIPEVRVNNAGNKYHNDMNCTRPLTIRDPAPKWTGPAIVNGTIKDISMDDYKGKYLVLFFYPLDFSFVCPTEIMAFSDRAQEFRDINCELVACSTDSVYAHLAWTLQARKEGGLGPLNIPLLSDNTHSISKSYQVYKEDDGTTFRGLFIIDPQQNLRQMTINDTQVGRSVDEILRLLQAFQYTDVHGEVCQAGWKPGDKGIKPTTSGKSQSAPSSTSN